MQPFVIKAAMLIFVHITEIDCSSQRVIERIRYLESRVNSESMFRDEDYADIIDKLDEIDERLNVSLEQRVSNIDFEKVEHLREDFTGITIDFDKGKSETETDFDKGESKTETDFGKKSETESAFGKVKSETETAFGREKSETETVFGKEKSETETVFGKKSETETAFGKEKSETETAFGREKSETESAFNKEKSETETAFGKKKSETARIRREIPKTENDFISAKQDMAKYCMTKLNKIEERITRVEGAYEFLKTNITLQIKKIIEEQVALRSDINDTSLLERKEFKNIAAKVEENIRNIVEKLDREDISQQIEINTITFKNIETSVNGLFIGPEQFNMYETCTDAKTEVTGVYKLQNGPEVFCDQTTDGGGWTVFQRRQNGEVDFYRSLKQYKNGFGDLNGEFWLGNKYLSSLTEGGDKELRIDMEDFEGNKVYAKYSKFKIYPKKDKYKLEVSGYSGNAGDSLQYHDGMAFTTFNNDNDNRTYGNCARHFRGAWWYKDCYYSNLNGQYFNEPDTDDYHGVTWFHWKQYYSLKRVEMKFC